MDIFGNLRFLNLGDAELRNVVIERLGSDPAGATAGRLYYNTTDDELRFYNGTTWLQVGTSTGTFASQQDLDNIITSLGFVNSTGEFNSSVLNVFSNISGLSGGSPTDSLVDALSQFDTAITSASENAVWANITGTGKPEDDATNRSVFFGSTNPGSPALAEDLWYNPTTGELNRRNNADDGWDVVATFNTFVESSTTPSSPTTGTLWFNPTANELSIYNGTIWVVVSSDSVNLEDIGDVTLSGSPVVGDILYFATTGNWENSNLLQIEPTSDTVTLTSGSLRLPDGTASAPSISFSSDTNTGLYVDGSDVLRLVTGGNIRFEANATGQLIASTTDYETLVTADDIIPNRKYVTDNFVDLTSNQTVAGEKTFSSNLTVTSNDGILIEQSQAELRLRHTTGALDEKNWILRANNNRLTFQLATDAAPLTATEGMLSFVRNGANGAYISVEDGSDFRVYDPTGNDFIQLSHDGTNASIATVGTSNLNVTGSASYVSFGPRIAIPKGTEALPGISFNGSPSGLDSGLFFVTETAFGSPEKVVDKVGVSVDGNRVATFEWLGSPEVGRVTVSSDTVVPGGQVLLVNSSATQPAYTFFGDENTGIFHDQDDEIGFSVGGNEALRIQSDGTLNVAAVANYESLVGTDDDIPNKKYVDDLVDETTIVRTTDGLGALDGVASSVSNAPRLHILFRSGSPVRWINGNELQVNENSFVQATVPFYITPGTSAVPGMAFSQSTGTGIGLGSPSFLVFYTAGTQKLYVEPDGTLHTLVGAYENLVTDDDDIPNKKYVDDEILALTQSNLNLNNNNIVNLAGPITGTDAANKEYVDQVASGISARQAVTVYVDADLATLYNTGSPPTAWTFTSGSPLGDGTTLTAPVNGQMPAVDGVTAFLNERILVANQTNAEENGIYVLSTLGNGSTPAVLTRCGSCNENDEIPSSFVFVQEGTTYADTGWVASVTDVTTFQVDVDPITWTQFTGAGSVVGGAGLTLTGTTLDVGAGLGITVNANDVQLDTLNTRNRDHANIAILAGAGLTGGGTIVADRTLNIGAGDGITVNANDVAVNSTVVRTTGAQTIAGVKTFSARIEGNGGSITNPSFTFSGDINTGMYNPNPDTVGISAGGDDCAYFTNQQVLGRADGTSADPAFSFINDPDTGTYNSGTNQLSFATGGTARISIQSDGTLVSNTASYETLVVADNDIPNKKYVDDQIAAISTGGSPISAGNGLVQVGGQFDVGAGDGITVNANDVAVDNTVVRTTGNQSIAGTKDFTGRIQLPPGTSSSPSIQFSNDTDTGIYQFGSPTGIGFAVDGAIRLALVRSQVLAQSGGSQTNPAYSFRGDADTGIYNGGPNANRLRFTTGGVERLIIDTDGSLRVTTNNYENLVVDDDDVPNKKYVDDLVNDSTVVRTTGNQSIGGIKTFTDQLNVLSPGTATVPSIAFTGDTDTGLYNPLGNTIRFTTGGTARFDIESNGTLHALTANYETLVTDDDDIPNKRYVDDEVAASARTAGDGLVLTGTAFDVGAGDGITVSANDVAVDSTVVRTTGNQTVGGTKTFSDSVRFASGTVSAPSITFNGDINTGIYRPSLDTVGISAGGDDCVYFTGQQIRGRSDGTVSDPPFSFIGDPDTGMYNSAANQLSFATGGTARISIQADGTLVSNTTLYENLVTGNNDIPNKKYVDDQIAAINVGSPVTAGNGLTETGNAFNVGAGDGITVNANDVAVNSTVVRTTGAQTIGGTKTFTSPIRNVNGSASAPSITFDSDPDTGIYRSSSDQLTVATGGTARISIQSDGTLVSNTASYETLVTGNNDIPNKKYVDDLVDDATVVRTTGVQTIGGTKTFTTQVVAAGNLLAPNFAMSGATDTGIYLAGGGALAFAVDANAYLAIDPDGTIRAVPSNYETLVIADDVLPNKKYVDDLVDDATVVRTTGNQSIAGVKDFTGRVRLADGNASQPSLSFTSDGDTGLTLAAPNTMRFVTSGVGRLQIEASGRLNAGVANYETLVNADNIIPNKKYVDDLVDDATVVRTTGNQTVGGTKTFSAPVRFALGSVSAPSITFNGDINTGMYRPSLDTVGISAGGDDCVYFTGQQIRGRSDGTQADPPFSFIGDPDTGLFNRGTNQLGWSCGGTERMFLDASGNLTADGDITAFSDIREKENLNPIVNALDKIKSANGYTYNRKGQTKRSIGVIAQELIEVVPEAVDYDEDRDRYSVAYGNLTALLIEAVKELEEKNASLEARIKELENK